MPGDRRAEPVALIAGQPHDVVVELGAGDIRVRLEELPAAVPDPRQRVAQRALGRVVAEHEGAAEVGFPVGEDRPQIQVGDVVVDQHPVRRVGVERQQ